MLLVDWSFAERVQRQELAQPAQPGHGTAQSLLPPSKAVLCLLLLIPQVCYLLPESAINPHNTVPAIAETERTIVTSMQMVCKFSGIIDIWLLAVQVCLHTFAQPDVPC